MAYLATHFLLYSLILLWSLYGAFVLYVLYGPFTFSGSWSGAFKIIVGVGLCVTFFSSLILSIGLRPYITNKYYRDSNSAAEGLSCSHTSRGLIVRCYAPQHPEAQAEADFFTFRQLVADWCSLCALLLMMFISTKEPKKKKKSAERKDVPKN